MDQRIKCLLRQANLQISDEQHKEWYIASLLPLLRVPLSQLKIRSQARVLEITMKLEASPIQDINIGVQ